MVSNYGKVGFDPGHFAGHNKGPNGYVEGDAMLKLGLKLQDKYGSFLTRDTGADVSFQARTQLAARAGCNTLISLHSNYPSNGVLGIYSLKHPGDKVIAEMIGREIAKAVGTTWRTWTRPSTNDKNTDYYAMIRRPVEAGIDHVFIVEHGSHVEMSVNTTDKIEKITECYSRILGLQPNLTAYQTAIKELATKVGIDYNYWAGKQNIDPYFASFTQKIAGCIK